jgi:hypothetical protein
MSFTKQLHTHTVITGEQTFTAPPKVIEPHWRLDYWGVSLSPDVAVAKGRRPNELASTNPHDGATSHTPIVLPSSSLSSSSSSSLASSSTLWSGDVGAALTRVVVVGDNEHDDNDDDRPLPRPSLASSSWQSGVSPRSHR